uniref:Glutamate receptor ionotropic, NMDA 3A n=1 Tax=Daphnia magna TaxID=35525 RepID=A0A0P6GYG2_9CRUS
MAYQRLVLIISKLLFLLVMATGQPERGASARAGPPSVRVLAVFDASEMATMERVMQKTLIALNKEKTAWAAGWNRQNSGIGAAADVNISTSSASRGKRRKWLAGGGRLTVDSVTYSSQWWINQTADDLDRLIVSHRPVAILVLSADDYSVFRVALAASLFHVPVIGARAQRGLDDSSFRGVSPFYVGLNPGPHHLASALHHLLLANNWLPLTLIVDDSLDAQKIRQVVQRHPSNVDKVMVVTVNRGSAPHRILAQLSGIQQTTSLVIAFCCEPRLASLIFREARRLNMLNGDWVWLALEQAVSDFHHHWTDGYSPAAAGRLPSGGWTADGQDDEDDWPLGLLGLVSQQPLRLTKHTMKGSLAIIHSSIRASLAVHQLQTWLDSWTNETSATHPIQRLQVAKKMDSEIRWRVKEALAGRLTYDGGGKIDCALRANFDVINLVPAGPFYPKSSASNTNGVGAKSTKTSASSSSTSLTLTRRRRHSSSTSDKHFGNATAPPPSELLDEDDEDLQDEEYPSAAEETNAAGYADELDADQDDSDGRNNGQPVVISTGAEDASLLNEPIAAKDPLRPPIWQSVGNVSGQAVTFKGVQWPGGGLAGPRSHSRRVYRVATIFSPPFVMETEVFKEDDEEEEEQRCLTGVPCLRVTTGQKDELARIFGDYEGAQLHKGRSYNLTCCYGYSIDLMENVASDLDVKFQVYVVADGQCGSAKRQAGNDGKWDGIVADLRSGAAHLSFAPLSVTSARSEAIDFSIPYFYSGLSILQASKINNDDVPLLAFLKPFRPDLWIGIFVSLNLTALAVAIYEWLSPFGLNPWGRQRTKNFSLASALWVMWGLLFSHLVAFKAPKSWPNKFLINVWGGFSVIFLASYTANIAALFAGVFSETAVTNFHDPRLLSQKVGTTRSSAAQHYAQKTNRGLAEHLERFTVPNLEEGIARLRDGRLDLLIGDTPILDYYRANDPGCTLRTVDVIEEDNYAVGMTKGLRLQTSISSLISSYSTSGYMDELRSKWYSSLPCSRSAHDAYRPQPLGVSAVAGVFILLGFGILGGCLILVLEHLVYKFALPVLRRQHKGTIWRSPNMMFFSQKLYRFINCVELLSPHHAAKELMHSLRQGQITSLFQKSVKRKENEQKRRRKSKAQFFEMIREVRRYQQEEKETEVADDEEDEEEYDHHHRVVDEETGEGLADDDEEEKRPQFAPPPPADYGDDCGDDSTSVVVVVAGQNKTPSSDDIAVYNSQMPIVTDSRFTVDPPLPSRSSDSERKWKMQMAQRRRSFSADALCEPAHIHQQRRRQGVRFAESSPSSSSNNSSEQSLSQLEDGVAGASAGWDNSEDNSSLLCSMVDKATLNKLTKEDLLLLWQAAESDWLAKVRALRKQRDILQLRYQHAKAVSQVANPYQAPPTPPLPTMKF